MQTAFAKILLMIFNKYNLLTSITVSKNDYEKVISAIKPLLEVLPNETYPKQEIPFAVEKKNEGFITSSQVQYVAKGANLLALGDINTGAMKVLETIMRYEYLCIQYLCSWFMYIGKIIVRQYDLVLIVILI